jgi:hypothetical protein
MVMGSVKTQKYGNGSVVTQNNGCRQCENKTYGDSFRTKNVVVVSEQRIC